MKTYSCKATVGDITEWCRANCTGDWQVDKDQDISGPKSIVKLHDPSDFMLFDLRWLGSAITKYDKELPEPVFTFEELNAEPEIVEARTYLIGEDHFYDSNKINKRFVDEILQWCSDNIQGQIMVRKIDFDRIVLGITDDDDRALFMMKWKSHPMVNPSRWEWSPDDV